MAVRFRSTLLVGALASLGLGIAFAETPPATQATAQADAQAHPELYDRDGKRICGYELMSDSERAGHKSQLHATKAVEDRDAIRVELCKSMKKRAQERGVKLQE